MIALSENQTINIILKEYLQVKKENYLESIFTPTEKQVYGLLEQGLNNNQICANTEKSISTLKNQINHMLRKLNARNRIEMITKVNTKFL